MSQKSSGQANNGQKSSAMAALMARAQSPFVTLKKGDLITGKISKLTTQEVLVDIGAKTEAVVLEKDRRLLRLVLSTLSVGSQVTVSVLNPESDMGNPVVSLRRHIDELLWKSLEEKQKKQEILIGNITDVTRGGYLVTTKDGVSGFLPNSQVEATKDTAEMIGKELKLYLIELNRAAHKVILSQKPAMDDTQFRALTKGLSTGQKVTAKVTTVTPFGAFVSIEKDGVSIDGLLHISELAWEKVEDPGVLYSAGQSVEAVIIGFDKDAKRVDLSVKRLTDDPFTAVAKSFTLDQQVTGTVTEVGSTGLTVSLATPEGVSVDAMIRKEKIPPGTTFEVGQTITATVSQIDAKRHRIVLVPVLLRKSVGYR